MGTRKKVWKFCPHLNCCIAIGTKENQYEKNNKILMIILGRKSDQNENFLFCLKVNRKKVSDAHPRAEKSNFKE